MASGTGQGRRPSALIAIPLVPVIVAIALSTFVWPAANLEPRDLPFGLAGPVEELGSFQARLEAREGAYDIHLYDDQESAREAIEDREIYGAIVAEPGGLRLLTSSAASPTVAALLTEDFAGPSVTVEDVVPADPDDPRGAAFSSMVLPLLLAGIVSGVIIIMLGRPGLGAIGILVAVAALTGLVTIAVVQGWLGVIEGPWLLNASVLSLGVLAIAAAVTGLAALIGRAGIAVMALLMVFVGNPWSGVPSAPELLPETAGFVGQLLPPGAGGQLLRSTAFYDGAGAGGQLAVLLVWIGLGLGAVLGGAQLRQRSAEARREKPSVVPGAEG
jgi:hypothetical protein